MSDTFAYRSGPRETSTYEIASGTVVEVGELLKLSSGKVLAMATSTDNLTFVGVAAEAHGATDPSGSIQVYRPNNMTVFEYALNAATDITVEDALQYNAARTLKKSTTDAIANAVKSKLQATSVLCTFRLKHATGNGDGVGDAS